MRPAAAALSAILALGSHPAAADAVRMRWLVPGDPGSERTLNAIVQDARPRAPGALRYRAITLRLPGAARLELAGGPELAPTPLPGFGNFYNDARAVVVGADDQETLTDDEGTPVRGRRIAAGEWAGVRGRFQAFLVKADVPVLVDAVESEPDRPLVVIAPESGAAPVTLTFYSGPVDPGIFPPGAPELANMLYAAIWEPLRWLSFGLRFLFERWHALVGQWGLAILLLSLSVKLLMAPLIWFAERWQAEVNRVQSLLQPELAAIKREFRGEEAHNRTLAVYRRHGVSPFHTFRSLGGFLIQIPVFIAAFDMLGEHQALAGAGFLWIRDLALPEQLLGLPFGVPFLGSRLNLLPVLMTFLTVAAARLQEDRSLIPELQRRQRLRLYVMAAAFFLLLYTFPAGMVLYWTANNFWHLLRVLFDRLRQRVRA